MDEHRLGLKPVLRRVWARRGRRPVVRVRPRYEWTWVYGFVEPTTGRTWWLILPRVNVEAFNRALAEFAAARGVGRERRVVLVLDQAGWHTSKKVVVPPGMTLVFLPARSPELQPAERLWTLVDEAVANRTFATLAALEEALVRRCRVLQAQEQVLIHGATCYHWWPQAA
jgi:DDE superfamily endonuclease